MNPGIHAGISFADYKAIDAMNNSKLKLFKRTPAHAHYALTQPDADTSAFRIGDAVHTAVLEPERFSREYVRAPRFDMRKTADKTAAAEWREAHQNKVGLISSEYDMACAMRDAAWSHPLARELLSGAGQNEATVIWQDKPTKLLCKARPDRFTTFRNWTTVVDVKTAENASVYAFEKACADYDYHMQAAWYLDGLNALAPHPRRFIHLVIEKTPPYCVAAFELDDPAIDEGRLRCRDALDTYMDCMASGEWPGYPVGVEGIDIPAWAYRLSTPPK